MLLHSIEKEFKIELIIFKYTSIKTTELFNTNLINPNDELIYLYDSNSLYEKLDYSNFSNMSDYYSKLIKNTNINEYQESPSIKYRDDTDMHKLRNIYNKMQTNPEYKIVDSKSWIQNIPDINSAKFLHYLNKDYGFYIKFYKKRFMHIDIKSFLNNNNSENINLYISEEKRIFNEEVHFFDHPYFGIVISIEEI
tara:strand:+ start:665 stop:1249 length:585 start_codon:yes stop_codon:yes gene_type:complete